MNLEELEALGDDDERVTQPTVAHPRQANTPANPSGYLVPPSNTEYETEVEFRPHEVFKFICGTAGTGKTFAVKAHREANRNVQLCATTGIAAVNLGGDATTINAALGFFDTKSLLNKSSAGALDNVLKWWARRGTTHWICDEVSMMDALQLTALVFAIEQVNEDLANVKDYDIEQQGHVRLTLVGDFAQLPPVKGDFAFEADEWDRFEPNTTMLTEIRRQTNREFIEALQLLRKGMGDQALGFFRDSMVYNRALDFDGTTLMGLNDHVNRYNKIKLSQVKNDRFIYRKVKNGKQRSEWDKNIPEELTLKVGALVMILSNRRHDSGVGFEYVNGDLGVVMDMDPDTCYVKLHRDGRVVAVEPVFREVEELVEKTSESGKTKKMVKEVVGDILYMPIRLAWASTIHKSQGLTLDKVQICFGDAFVGHPGMLYVAMSRARSFEGIRLVGDPDVFPKRCQVDEKVRRWL